MKRIWWIFPLLAIFEIAVAVTLGWLLHPEGLTFYWGLGIGIAAGMIACLSDSPPQHIERWRQGAQGEKQTAKALKPLTKSGWTLIHDLDRPRGGNIDHVLIGPGGVFVLETKNLSGICSVREGILSVRWREDPEDGYENVYLAKRTRATAAEISEVLGDAGVHRNYVQGVIVLWADFQQRSMLSGRVGWVHGKSLAGVLSGRPARLDDSEIERAVTALARR